MEKFYGRKGELRVTAQRVGDHLASSQRRALHLGCAHVPNTVLQTHARANIQRITASVNCLAGVARTHRDAGLALRCTTRPKTFLSPTSFAGFVLVLQVARLGSLAWPCSRKSRASTVFNASITAFVTGGLTDAYFATAV